MFGFGARATDLPDDIDSRYATALELWSLAHGCLWADYSEDQAEALQALRVAGGNATAAGLLLYGQLLYESGRIGR